VEEVTAAGRKAQIRNLTTLQRLLELKHIDIQIVWIGARTQPAIEKLFGVESYPNVILISNTKNVYANYVGSYQNEEIVDFVARVLKTGRGLGS